MSLIKLMKWNSALFDEIRGTLKTTNTTFRIWKGRRIAEKKPIPRQVYSHLQLYQRSLYKAALERWKSLTVDEKEYWKAEAGKIGLDGHNLYIRQYITDFGKPVSAWLFLEGTGYQITDKYGINNGTLTDGTWEQVDGWNVINLDGVNDEIQIPDSPTYKLQELTVTVFFNNQDTGNHHFFMECAYPPYGALKEGSRLMYHKDGKDLRFGIGDGNVGQFVLSGETFDNWGEWNFLAGGYSDSEHLLILYHNGTTKRAASTTISVVYANVTGLTLGHSVLGKLAEVRIYPFKLRWNELDAIWQVYQKSPLFS